MLTNNVGFAQSAEDFWPDRCMHLHVQPEQDSSCVQAITTDLLILLQRLWLDADDLADTPSLVRPGQLGHWQLSVGIGRHRVELE